MKMGDLMIRVRSAEELQFVLSLMSEARGKVAMWTRKDLQAWRKVYMGMVERAGMVHQAVKMDFMTGPCRLDCRRGV